MKPIKHRLLFAIGILWIGAGCTQVQITQVPSSTPAPAPTRTPAPSHTPTPNLPGTADAARFALTVQAYQTQVSAEKATERVGGSTDTPESLAFEILSPINLDEIEQIEELQVGQIFGAAFEPDRRHIVLLVDGSTVVLGMGLPIDMTVLDGESFNTTVFPSSGTGFAAGFPDGSLVLVNTEGVIFEIPDLHTGRITGLSYFPGNNDLLTAGEDGTMQVIGVSTGEIRQTILLESAFGLESLVSQILFSPDGAEAAVYLYNQSTLWLGSTQSLLNGAPEGSLLPWLDHAGPIADVHIEPNWQSLAWVSRGTLQFMSLDGDLIGESIHHMDWILNTAFLADPEVFLATTIETEGNETLGMIKGYSPQTGDQLLSLAGPSPISAFDVSQNGLLAVAGHYDGVIRAWDLQTQMLLFSAPTTTEPLRQVVFNTAEDLLAAVDANNAVWLIETATGGVVKMLPPFNVDQIWLGFDFSGKFLTVVSTSGEIEVFGVRP